MNSSVVRVGEPGLKIRCHSQLHHSKGTRPTYIGIGLGLCEQLEGYRAACVLTGIDE